MKLSAIVAMSHNRVIGRENTLPWHLPQDLQYFKKVTLGKPVMMGRKTYQSIGRPLPGRQNIIVTHDTQFEAPGCEVVHSIDAALQRVNHAEEVFVIGGALLYEQLLPLLDYLYITLIEAEVEGDTYFPLIDFSQWVEVSNHPHALDANNALPYRFLVLARKKTSFSK